MRSEDYDAFLVYSTRIFTCLTYAEYRQTFKYLYEVLTERGERRLSLLAQAGRLIVLIHADVPYYIVATRLQPLFLKLLSF